MIDIKLIRDNKQVVIDNLKKKFQDYKIVIVEEIEKLDKDYRATKTEADELRNKKNVSSKTIGDFIAKKDIENAQLAKKEVANITKKIADLEEKEAKLEEQVKEKLLTIPNIIHDSVPIGKSGEENVELKKYGEIKNNNLEIPYHVDILESFNSLDLNSARKVSGAGFYYLEGEIAQLHSAILSYARDFMIKQGFKYAIPPFMIRKEVVSGVMSFTEMDNMMYKIEGEDLYLVGTSEHSMIGKFSDTIIDEQSLPICYTSYSPCFRKEKGAHGIEERGIFRIHQFEKQEMIVLCKPEDSFDWYEKMLQLSISFFESLSIPIRTLESCSGDLADLKAKGCDIEAWSPRQQKYYEVCSCTNMTDAQARRLKIRVNTKEGKYFVHTLNNTVVAPPRMLIAFIENNIDKNGHIHIPTPLQSYMLDKEYIDTKLGVLKTK